MDKLRFMQLWDTYNGLLTPTQQEITNLYFNLDLTLSEIAEEKAITRQGVSECLKTCKKQLEEYENKLHFLKRTEENSLKVSLLKAEAESWAQEFSKANPEFVEDVNKLNYIIIKDYSKEVERILKEKGN